MNNVSHAQVVGAKNLGFENGNFDGWKGYGWTYSTANDVASTFNTSPALVSLPSARRHVIISDQSAYDSNTGNKLKMIPEGYAYSARLGDEIISSDGSPRCWQQSLKYTISVDSSNAFLLLKFACVLEYSAKHDNVTEMEPRFQLALYDQDGIDIEDCSNYQAYASGEMEEEFNTYNPGAGESAIKWRDWTTVGADLSDYIGQDITIEFLSADCTGHYHFGYTYFVVDCMPLYITVDYCTGDSRAILAAPDGFENYQWLDIDSITIIGNEQELLVANPQEGVKYYCQMESETGCEVVVSAEVEKYEPHADFSWEMIDCFSNEVELINNSTTNTGDLSYLWILEDDITSAEESFPYKFATSGLHEVGLIVYNPPSGCTDTLFKMVESFSPPLVGVEGYKTYCPGMTTELKAFGAYSYEWSTGDIAESMSFAAPGGDYWLLGYSTPEEGCVSDTIPFSISEEPDWTFELFADSFLCEGTTSVLKVEGGTEYLWNTGDTTNSIEIETGNTFAITGKNARGCEKDISFTVTYVANPKMDFSLSTHNINIRKNIVECKAWSDDDVDFEWDMGDGTIQLNPVFSHSYFIPQNLVTYNVNITGINKYGCFVSDSTKVVVEPFVPNVFTPNNDGINDLYMPGYQLKIFDRYGIVLYEGENGWDGFYNGQEADPDTYYYLLKYIDGYQNYQEKTGFLTLIR